MSYRKRHVKSKIYTIKPRKPIFKKLWFWILILLLLIILSGAYFVLFYSGFQLKNIIISGNVKVGTQDLEKTVSDHSETSLFNVGNIKVVSKSIFLINDSKINEDILKKFPEIGGLTIEKKLPQTLILGVAERKPLGIFCDNANKCYLIDENGIIFEPLIIKPADTTIVRQMLESKQVFTGEQVIAQNIISAISKIKKSLKDKFQINLDEALVTSPVRLDVKTDKNWKVYFDLDVNSDINLQLTKLNLLLDGGISPDSEKNLKYIDLRPKDRAIVCDNSTCGGQ
ncbi:MAG: cell division protein FtsQ/DivIB [Candidatus Staskawiczbacteria bacterium]|nr:cell division protein FtsQ/DivIB [Candidatus Staskawiczbacteria bacterium]